MLRARFDHLLDGVALATPLPAGTTSKTIADHPADIRDLASPLRGLVEVALSRSVAAVFLTAIPLAVIGDSTIPKATDESSGQEPLAAAH